MKQILAMSILHCFSLVMNKSFTNYAIISVQDGCDNLGISFKRSKRCKAVLELEFDDIDSDKEKGILFTNKNAEKIIRFVQRYEDIDTLIIHCNNGLSRSAAIKNALDECFELPSLSIPAVMNRHIYSTIIKTWHKLQNADVNTAERMEY